MEDRCIYGHFNLGNKGPAVVRAVEKTTKKFIGACSSYFPSTEANPGSKRDVEIKFRQAEFPDIRTKRDVELTIMYLFDTNEKPFKSAYGIKKI